METGDISIWTKMAYRHEYLTQLAQKI